MDSIYDLKDGDIDLIVSTGTQLRKVTAHVVWNRRVMARNVLQKFGGQSVRVLSTSTLECDDETGLRDKVAAAASGASAYPAYMLREADIAVLTLASIEATPIVTLPSWVKGEVFLAGERAYDKVRYIGGARRQTILSRLPRLGTIRGPETVLWSSARSEKANAVAFREFADAATGARLPDQRELMLVEPHRHTVPGAHQGMGMAA